MSYVCECIHSEEGRCWRSVAGSQSAAGLKQHRGAVAMRRPLQPRRGRRDKVQGELNFSAQLMQDAPTAPHGELASERPYKLSSLDEPKVAAARLVIRVDEVSDLRPMDSHSSDPYVLVRVDDVAQHTSVKVGCLDAAWHESFDFAPQTMDAPVLLQVWDKDADKDDFMGEVCCSINRLLWRGMLPADNRLTPLAHRTVHVKKIVLILFHFPAFGSNLAQPTRTDLNLYVAWNKENEGRTTKPRTTETQNETRAAKQIRAGPDNEKKPYLFLFFCHLCTLHGGARRKITKMTDLFRWRVGND